MSTDVRVLLTRAITRLMAGDKDSFKKLAIQAEDMHRNDTRLYVTVEEILKAKRAG